MLADHIGVPQLRDLASRSEQLTDSIRLGGMSRLASLLHSGADLTDKELIVRVEFLGGMQGFPEISGHLSGSLDIRCQRCLGSLNWPVDLDFHLVVVGSEADVDEVAEPFDAVIAGEHGVQLMEVIEDELLSSLPLAPMHTNVANCETSAELRIISDVSDNAVVENETNKPFGNLAALIEGNESADKTGKT
jgi:uncharacterized protein